jgi:hypothetical protein
MDPIDLALPTLPRIETDPVSGTLCSIGYRTMEKVQKLSNSECYIHILMSESFEIQIFACMQRHIQQFSN